MVVTRHWVNCPYENTTGHALEIYPLGTAFNTCSNHNWKIRVMTSLHYDDVIMGTIASQITSLTIVYSTVSKLRATGLCAGNSPVTCGEFTGDRWIPRAQMASNAENVSIWWRHHGFRVLNTNIYGSWQYIMLWRIPIIHTFHFTSLCHDNIIEWKHFPRCCPFERGIQRCPVDSPHKRQSFDVFFDRRLDKWLSKQSRCRWFETPSRSLWRHCNVETDTVIYSNTQPPSN